LWLGDSGTPVVYQTIQDGRPKYSQACPVCGKRRQRDDIDSTWLIEAVKKHIQKPVVYYFDRANTFNANLAEHIRSQNGIVIFEPSSVVEDEVFRRCLKASHVVKYAKDRIEGLPESNAKCDFVEIQTLGAEGLRFKMPHSLRWAFMPSIPAPFVADSGGSGDWCTAGAVHWFAEHSLRPSRHNIRVALRFGQALASIVYANADMTTAPIFD
jgi:fructokinase